MWPKRRPQIAWGWRPLYNAQAINRAGWPGMRGLNYSLFYLLLPLIFVVKYLMSLSNINLKNDQFPQTKMASNVPRVYDVLRPAKGRLAHLFAYAKSVTKQNVVEAEGRNPRRTTGAPQRKPAVR
jgi:hypothetical protein